MENTHIHCILENIWCYKENVGTEYCFSLNLFFHFM